MIFDNGRKKTPMKLEHLSTTYYILLSNSGIYRILGQKVIIQNSA